MKVQHGMSFATHHFDLAQLLEWSGAAIRLTGAFLLATNSRYSRYGWIGFLFANFFMLGFAIEGGHLGLLTQQAGFTVTSILGIYRSGFLKGRR
jgi:hypothetical protein